MLPYHTICSQIIDVSRHSTEYILISCVYHIQKSTFKSEQLKSLYFIIVFRDSHLNHKWHVTTHSKHTVK